MAGTSVPPNRGAEQIKRLLDSPEICDLIADLEATRWTGRPGYPVRTMVGVVLVKSLYVLPTWTRTVALVTEHDALRVAIGGVPSIDACYRFARKLREHKALLDTCIAQVVIALREQLPEYGENVAIDGSDLPAYSNGQRYVYNHGPERKRFADPDASWGHRSAISTRKGGGFNGYRLHAAICTSTGLPVAWETKTARDAEAPVVPVLLDAMRANGFRPVHMIADRGYDVCAVYDACESRGIRPIIPLRLTGKVVAGEHRPPSCDHGTWTFAGSDAKRGAAKYRCPSAACSPASVWIKADRLCRPPAAWDHPELSFARSMGPPFRQSWDHPRASTSAGPAADGLAAVGQSARRRRWRSGRFECSKFEKSCGCGFGARACAASSGWRAWIARRCGATWRRRRRSASSERAVRASSTRP